MQLHHHRVALVVAQLQEHMHALAVADVSAVVRVAREVAHRTHGERVQGLHGRAAELYERRQAAAVLTDAAAVAARRGQVGR